MADNDQNNDEYHFDNPDDMTPTSGDNHEEPFANSQAQAGMPPLNSTEGNIKRNIFIGVVIVILALVAYKFMATSISSKTTPDEVAAPAEIPTVAAVPPPAIPVATQPQPEMIAPQVVASDSDAKINQTLGAIEVTQQSLRTGMTSVNDQLGGINTNINAMMTKITELNGIIVSLSEKVDEQAIVIEKLTYRKPPKQNNRVTKNMQPRLKFYLQAVIPGRAWLIATNGTTLTVREGTTIEGYGMVKLIDPTQGRVTTSSGQVIRFSQEDS